MRSNIRSAVVLTAVLVVGGCTSGGSTTDAPTAGTLPGPTAGTASGPTTAPSAAGEARFPAPGTAALSGADAKTLQAVLDDVIRRYRVSPENSARGVTAAVVTDRWRWTGSAGVDGTGKRLEPRTELALASITKTFVAAEVVTLDREGKVDLDKPLKDYVRHRLTENGATVRQYLSMVSGVPDYTDSDYRSMDKAFRANPGRRWTPQEALSHYAAKAGEPGLYVYSNPNYILLGMLIEAVTHQPLASALRKDLMAGLPRVAVQDTERPQPPIGSTRVCPGPPDGYLPCRSFASASAAYGGMTADAMTTALWGYQLYGGRVVPPAAVTEMTGGQGDYGLGTMRFSQQFGLGDAVGHLGEVPGFSSALVVVPEHRVSVALLFTDDRGDLSDPVTALLTGVQKVL